MSNPNRPLSSPTKRENRPWSASPGSGDETRVATGRSRPSTAGHKEEEPPPLPRTYMEDLEQEDRAIKM